MKVAEIVNFNAANEDASFEETAPRQAGSRLQADPDDVRMLVSRFIECNSQYMIGVIGGMTVERFCNDTILNHLLEQGLTEEAEYEAYVVSLIRLLDQCRHNHFVVYGLNARNAHILDRMIMRLQMELLPTPDNTARQLRSVLSHTGVPYKLEEFIAMSKGAAYVRWHWGDLIAAAEAKGGHAVRVARGLQKALDELEEAMPAPAAVDIMALAMGQF